MINESSTSTPTTSRQPNRTPAKSSRHAGDGIDYAPEVLPRSSSSSLTSLYSNSEFRLSWDNDVKHQIARNLLHLRRYRGESQAEVASGMGTSQSAVARIEAGEENFTANTLERWIRALRGRFDVRILPQEFPFQPVLPWWENERRGGSGWSVNFMAYEATGNRERALIGMERTTTMLLSGAST